MAQLKPGDRVDCLIKLYDIIIPYDLEYDYIKTFEIISQDRHGYYLYVPNYIFLNQTTKLDKYLCKQLQIDEKFIDENIIYISENLIYQISSVLDGAFCVICNTFCQYACANQPDGTLICWSCRQNKYRY